MQERRLGKRCSCNRDPARNNAKRHDVVGGRVSTAVSPPEA